MGPSIISDVIKRAQSSSIMSMVRKFALHHVFSRVEKTHNLVPVRVLLIKESECVFLLCEFNCLVHRFNLSEGFSLLADCHLMIICTIDKIVRIGDVVGVDVISCVDVIFILDEIIVIFFMIEIMNIIIFFIIIFFIVLN